MRTNGSSQSVRVSGWSVVIGLLLWAATGQAADRPQRLNLGTLAPQGSLYHQALQTMGEAWRKAPGAGVRLQLYPGGQLGGDAEMVRLMRDGTLQAGLLTVVGLSLIEPGVAGMQDFPMAFRSLEEFDHIGERLQPMLEARMAENGFVVLFWADAGWVRFFSKEPMLVPSDLAKMKVFVWSGNPEQVDIMRKAGYAPVPLESTDILLGLRTGMINVSPAPPIWALASQIYQVAPHMLELNWAPLLGACVVKKEAWEKIPQAAREEMRKAAIQAGVEIKANSRAESERAVKAMEARGLKVHPVTPEMEAQWRQAAEKVYPDIRGRLVPAETFDEVLRWLKEYRAAGGAP